MVDTAVSPPSAAAAPWAQGERVVHIDKLWSIFGEGESQFAVHQDLDLDIYRGEMLSIVGGSGTGKTVLLRQILGLARPTRGTVTVLGRPASEMGREGAASRVGMLFQHGALFSAFSVLENIAFPLRELKLLPDELIRNAALVKLQIRMVTLRHSNSRQLRKSNQLVIQQHQQLMVLELLTHRQQIQLLPHLQLVQMAQLQGITSFNQQTQKHQLQSKLLRHTMILRVRLSKVSLVMCYSHRLPN